VALPQRNSFVWPDKIDPPSDFWLPLLRKGAALTERQSKAFLADHGFPVTRERLAREVGECVAAAEAIGYPVAMKIESPDLPHKTEIGGVALNLTNAGEVRDAYDRIIDAVMASAPRARVNGVLIQEMVAGGFEAVAGLARHDPFGLAVIVGSGGVLVELLADSALALPPIGHAEAIELIRRTKMAKLLDGFRGSPAADTDALAQVLCRLSELALSYAGEIEALDLNPVTVLPQGQGVRILDALLLPSIKSRSNSADVRGIQP
jgi:succinyl-CoA synthetase beta subunit